MKWAVIALLLIGCVQSKKEKIYNDKIKKLLDEDRINKELELTYLKEIMIAQENNDTQAYRFYLNEYISVPRLDIPENLKKTKDYFIGGKSIKY